MILSRPLPPAALSMMIGLMLGRAWPWPGPIGVIGAGLAAAGLLYALWRRWRPWQTVFLCLLFFSLGLWRIGPIAYPDFAANHIARRPMLDKVYLQGNVMERPVHYLDERTRFIVAIDGASDDDEHWTRATGRVLVYARGDWSDLRVGDRLQFPARFTHIARRRTPGTYDRAWLWAQRGVHVQTTLYSHRQVEVVPLAPDAADLLPALKDRVCNLADRYDPLLRGLVYTLVLGQRNELDPYLRDTFRRAGLTHVLVVSGLHITAVAGILFWLIWVLLTRWPRVALRLDTVRLAALAALPAAIAYILLAGVGTSVLRAGVMFVMVLVALLLQRRHDPPSTVAFAALIVLLIYPGALWSAGFQFSFLAVLGMMHWHRLATALSAPWRWDDPLRRRGWLRLRRTVVHAFVLSVAAFLFTLPVALWHFGEASFWAPLTNLVAVPAFSLLIVPGLLAGTFLQMAGVPGAAWLWDLARIAFEQIHGVALLFAQWGGDPPRLGRPTFGEIVAWYVCLATLPLVRQRFAQRVFVIGLITLVALPIGHSVTRSHGDDLAVHLLDVGQGLSAFVDLPGGRYLLLDAGYDPDGRVVAAYLKARRIRHVDVVVSTHPHPDHYQGLIPVLKQFSVGEIWTIDLPRPTPDTIEWHAMLDRATARGIPVHRLDRASPPRQIGETSWHFLGPPHPSPKRWSLNDLSLIIRLDWRGQSALFLADAEKPAEAYLLVNGLSPTDLVQVAHHGSDSSSTMALIDRLQVRHALVPVGLENTYRLPDQQVLTRWTKSGAHIWRTDLHGTISCANQGSDWDCRVLDHRPAYVGQSGFFE